MMRDMKITAQMLVAIGVSRRWPSLLGKVGLGAEFFKNIWKVNSLQYNFFSDISKSISMIGFVRPSSSIPQKMTLLGALVGGVTIFSSEFDPSAPVSIHRVISLDLQEGSIIGKAIVHKTFYPITGAFTENTSYSVHERRMQTSMLGFSGSTIGMSNISLLPTLNVSPWQYRILTGQYPNR